MFLEPAHSYFIHNHIADQFAPALIGQFAEGMTCYHTQSVMVCRPSAYFPGGADLQYVT